MRPRRLLPLAVALAMACPAHAAPPPRPALVVLVVLDQLRPDYLERWRPQFTGGLARLLEGGAVFPDARYEHAISQTAPGHATLLSGRYPASTGVLTNDRGVPDPGAPLLETLGEGASPRVFRGTTLHDWLLAVDGGTRALSVSRKDRGAILPIGRARAEVYWWGLGQFTTSRWYRGSLPGWVRAWNARRPLERLAGTTWELLLPAAAYAEPDDLPGERDGRVTFPHPLPRTADSLRTRIIDYPWMDSLTLDLALEGTRQLGLGARGAPDLLSISLSTLDRIGHQYGPDSRELHDHLLRADRWLGWFLDSLAVLVPGERVVVALASDHGIMPMPEQLAARGVPTGRLSWRDLVRGLRDAYEGPRRTGFGLAAEYGLLLADTSRLRAHGVDVDRLADSLARVVRAQPGIRRVFTPRSLRAARRADPDARRWRLQLPPDEGWLVAAMIADHHIWSGPREANHGSPLPLDMTVPLILAGPGVRPGRYPAPVRVVDLAPTLARLAGVRPTEPVAGRPLLEALAP